MVEPQKIDPNSLPYILGGIHQELESLNREQKNINNRLNNQNGQIRAMAEALARNTEAVKTMPISNREDIEKLCEWKDHHEAEHRRSQGKRLEAMISMKNAIFGGLIIAAVSVGLTILVNFIFEGVA